MFGSLSYFFSLTNLAFLIVVNREDLRPQNKFRLIPFSQLTVLVRGKEHWVEDNVQGIVDHSWEELAKQFIGLFEAWIRVDLYENGVQVLV